MRVSLCLVVVILVGCSGEAEVPVSTPEEDASAGLGDAGVERPDLWSTFDFGPPVGAPVPCEAGSIEIAVDGPPAECEMWLPSPERIADSWPLSLRVPGAGGSSSPPLVGGPEGCFGAGWYLRDLWAPRRLGLCPETCQQVTTGTLTLSWECIEKPPFEPPTGGSGGTDAPKDCTPGSIFGLVCSPSYQVWMAEANVAVAGPSCDGDLVTQKTLSDKNGFFYFEEVPPGLRELRITIPGLDPLTYPVHVAPGQLTDMRTFARKQCHTIQAPICESGKQGYTVPNEPPTRKDVIIAVDTSGSMSDEATAVEANLNAFAEFIAASGFDYRVVLIADTSICIPPPLGGAECSDGERLRHVHHYVNSHSALNDLIQTYAGYGDFLRPDADTHFLVITDDDAAATPDWFVEAAAEREHIAPPFVFHGVVGMGPLPNGCSTAAKSGDAYIALAAETGGLTYPICEAVWSSVFEAVAAQTGTGSCSVPLEHPEAVGSAGWVEVTAEIEGVVTPLTPVKSVSACGAGRYVLSTAGSPWLLLCPQACAELAGATLSIEWQCLGPDI